MCQEPASVNIEGKHMTNHYLVLAVAFLLVASLASAQNVDPALRPPKGAQVALVVFEDLQCPDCRRAAPLVEEAARTYKIPVVRHDFPLPMHNWSYDAALIARYFDTHSKQLGNDFRDYIFEHQPEITPPTLRAFAEKFAADHKVDLPFAVDPQGKLAEGDKSGQKSGSARRHQSHPDNLRGQQQDPRQTLRRSSRPHPTLPVNRRHEERIKMCKM